MVFNYANIKGATAKNLGKVIQVNFPDANPVSPNNFFTSQYSKDTLEGPEKFSSAQFHFHAKSEHTINGRRFDLEMHTVHLADKGKKAKLSDDANAPDVTIFASATGLIFDRYNYDPTITGAQRLVIDKFFDSLNMQNKPANNHNWASAFDMTKNTDIPYKELLDI